MAYFFAALALGLLGGIKSHLIIVAILMILILASLWVGDHPALMRYNRNQTVTIDRAISNEDELILELEDLLGAQIRSVDLKNLDLVNDTTIVEVHYRLRRRARTAPPATQPKDTGAQQVRQAPQESAPRAPHLIEEVPLQTPTPIQPVQTPTPIQSVGQQAWPGALSHDSAASAATAPPRHDWITGNRQQHTPQRHSQPSAPPPPVANPRYN